MDFRLIARQLASSNNDHGILAHWVLTIPILLVVAAFSFPQIDLYGPSPDEFYSMNNAGWLSGEPFSLINVVESLHQYSPTHTPAYFLLLHIWGRATSDSLATGRVLSVFCGLLSLAIAYRLARDFVAPVAGLFAVFIVASNAYYNLFIADLRMYPLLLSAAGIVFWQYLRIVYQIQTIKTRHYVALGFGIYFLANTHVLSATFLLTIGLYHVFIVPRNHKWKMIVATACVAMLSFLPWAFVFMSIDANRVAQNLRASSAGSWDAIAAWMVVTTNGQPLLLALPIGGLVLASLKTRRLPRGYLTLSLPFLLLLGVISDATSLVSTLKMRYYLTGWWFLVLALVGGLYGLYCHRRWLIILVPLSAVAGLLMTANADWRLYIAGRQYALASPPWQVISSQAVLADQFPRVTAYRIADSIVEWPSQLNYSQKDYFFERPGIDLRFVSDSHAFRNYVSQGAIESPSVWLLYQEAQVEV